MCIHQLFEDQVARTPNAVAVIAGNEQRTYLELNREANRLAHHLRALSAGPEVLVGILTKRSPAMVSATLAILKAGGAYVPLDLAFPKERLDFLLADAQIKILLCERQLLQLSQPVCQVVCLETAQETLARYSEENPNINVTGENLAYVIYTSGSTGRPKGVEVTHQAVVNMFHAWRTRTGFSSKEIVFAVTTLSFDIAALELLLPLTVGARVVIASSDVVAHGPQLVKALNSSGATVMQATPTTWRMLLESGWQGNPHLNMFCGGETLSRELANKLLAKGAALWNLYGPTEATIWSTAYQVAAGEGPVPIGQPLANTEISLRDERQQSVAPGAPGELYIGGSSLARGYLHRPELTAERFIRAGNGRLYRTGDLARLLPDANMQFLGRLDSQVKIRGFRIELAEIESVLREHPSVYDAAVHTRETSAGDTRLIGSVVLKDAQETAMANLRAFLTERLPDYMVPASLIPLDALPVTPHGKIDRQALSMASLPDRTLKEDAIAPRDAMELQIKQVIEKILDLGAIGITDNFFDLGGSSIAAVELISALENQFGYEIPLDILRAHPTVEHLAHTLRKQSDFLPISPLVAIKTGGKRPPIFCVHGAGGLVFPFYDLAHHLDDDQPVYGLQDPSLGGKKSPLNRVEDMAAEYVATIRLVQPQGPYLLAGLSFGGLIVFEMAQQLRQQEERIGLLALFDTPAPVSNHLAATLKARFTGMKRHLQFIFGVCRHVLPYLQDYLFLSTASARYRHEKLPMGASILGNALLSYFQAHSDVGKVLARESRLLLNRQPTMRRSIQLLSIHERARRQYLPKDPYLDRITLFRSTLPTVITSGYQDGALGWRKLVQGEIEIHPIPGSNHFNLMRRPFVQRLGETLSRCIAAHLKEADSVQDKKRSG